MKYYRLDKILKCNAQYNIIVSGRSDGKTYACLEHIIERYFATDEVEQGAIIRRWQDDFTGKRGQQMFASIVSNGLIEKYSNGKWNNVRYYASKWYMCLYDSEAGKIVETSDRPFCYGFAITAQEHDKSTAYPDICNILFDEFITRGGYLPDEFVLFCNVLSTIIRERDNVRIFMCGNTINKYCPYFAEMGINHVDQMEQGTIDIYRYGDDSALTVAVEFPATNRLFKKKSNVYFAFDNPKLQMITSGIWELDIYKHIPRKYAPKEVVFNFFIQFESQLLHCEVVEGSNDIFVAVHPKTTPIQNPLTDLIYTTQITDGLPNVRKSFLRPVDQIDRKISLLYNMGKFFYCDNNTGDILKNFLDVA